MNKLNPAIVVGTGSHSKPVISLLRRSFKYDLRGLLDLSKEFNNNEKIMNVPVIGCLNELEKISSYQDHSFFIAVGDNIKRREIFNFLNKKELNLPNLIDPTAFIDVSSTLGKANILFYNSFLGPLVKIGSNNIINTSSIIEHDSIIYSHCHIAPQSLICGNCLIEDLCFIGASATVINNLKISSNNIIGSGSTVIRTITESFDTYVGSPAKKIRNLK